MEFRVLGPVSAMGGGVPVGLGGPKQRAVLAALVLRPGELVSNAALVETVWPGDPPDAAAGVVRTYASRLRRALSAHGAQLVSRPPGYVLEIDPSQVDAHHFERLVTTARGALAAGDPEAASTTLGRALALWRGEALADLSEFDTFQPAAARLEHLRLSALEDRIDAELVLGHHAEVVAELEVATAQHPFRERFWGQLIVALYRSGRQTDALAAYQALRSTLVDEVGLDPSPGVLALESQILNHADELQWRPRQPADRGDPLRAHSVGRASTGGETEPRPVPRRGFLPVQLTRFVGREAESTELLDLVTSARVVTLVGAPGCGKTRLAIELGAALEPGHAGGVWFVELAPVADASLVTLAVAGVLGVREKPGRLMDDALLEALADAQDLVLVLDNCEHVADAAARLVERVIGSCPSVRVLATSRTRLGVAGERLWNVPPLAPGSAAELFVDRARLAARGLRLDDSGSVAVDEICARLDYVPLAIELAAAWTRVLSLGQILDRLDRPSPVLTGGPWGADPRHKTMADTVAWSCELLPPAAQELFERLSVFAGTFDLEAVEAVANPDTDVLGALAALVDHSLVLPHASPDGPMRYRLLEPVRQCGAAALTARGETDVVRRRHAEHYLALARLCDPFGMHGVEPTHPLALLEREEGNLLSAVSWARTQPPDLALRLCEALAPLWEFRGPLGEGRAWLEATLAAGTRDDELRIAALARAGKLAWRQGEYERARALLEESRSVARRTGHPWWAANVGSLLGLVAWSSGDTEAAVRHCNESAAVAGADGHAQGFPWNLIILGWASYAEGDATNGDAQMHAALDANQAFENPTVDAHALCGLTFGAFLSDNPTVQRAHLLAALEAMRQAGGYFEDADWVGLGAILAAREGRSRSAMRLVGAMLTRRERDGSHSPEQFTNRTESLFAGVVEDVGGQAAAAALVTEGAEMTMDEIVAEIGARH